MISILRFICDGGGGIPVIQNVDGGLEGVEAVIDEDRAAGLLAEELSADAFPMLTDVDAVYEGWGQNASDRSIAFAPPRSTPLISPPGSMGPKVEAATAFASVDGWLSGIGKLEDARAILERRAGTTFSLE